MGLFNMENRFMRFAVFMICLVWFRSKVRKVYKQLMEARRRRAMLMKLPQGGEPRMHFLGTVTSMVPKEKPLTAENISKYFVQQFVKEAFKPWHENEGLLCLWVLNPYIPLHSFGAVFVHDIDLARQILSSKNQDKYEKGLSYKICKPLIGHGVLSTSGMEHAAQRPLVEKGFKVNILKANMPQISKTAKEHCDKFLRQCEANNGVVEVDVNEELLKVTLDVLGRFAFSYDINSVTAPTTADAPLYHAFEFIITHLESRVRNPLKQTLRKMRLPENIRFEKEMQKLESVVQTIIGERMTAKAEGKVDENQESKDLLDVLLKGMSKEEAEQIGVDGSGEMTKEKMIDNIKTLLFAGHDTTASALTWFIHLLAANPQVADKLRQEARQHLGSRDEILCPDLDKLECMPYMNACVLELLRLYPSAAFTRTCKEDIRLGKYDIPQGTELFVYPYVIHRDPKNFEKPNEFLPERWIADKTGSEQLTLQAQLAKETRSKALLPFSLGPRNCVGRPLALVEIRVIMLHILFNFDLEVKTPNPDFQDWPGMTLTLVPRGIKVLYKKRAQV